MKSRIGSSKHKVIGNGTIEKIMHDLLLIELFDVAYYIVALKCGHSTLLKIVPFNRPYTTFYWSAIAIALSCTIFELFDV